MSLFCQLFWAMAIEVIAINVQPTPFYVVMDPIDQGHAFVLVLF